MAVLLTGATGGKVGRAVLAACRARGLDVVALVRRPAELPGARTVLGCLDRPGDWLREAREAEGIIHLACTRSNVKGMRHLAGAWRRGNLVQVGCDRGKEVPMAVPAPGRGARVALRVPVLLFPGEQELLGPIREQLERGGPFVFDSEEGLESYGTSFVTPEDLGEAAVDALGLAHDGAYNVASGFVTWKTLLEQLGWPELVVREGARPEHGELRLPQTRSFLETASFARAVAAARSSAA